MVLCFVGHQRLLACCGVQASGAMPATSSRPYGQSSTAAATTRPHSQQQQVQQSNRKQSKSVQQQQLCWLAPTQMTRPLQMRLAGLYCCAVLRSFQMLSGRTARRGQGCCRRWVPVLTSLPSSHACCMFNLCTVALFTGVSSLSKQPCSLGLSMQPAELLACVVSCCTGPGRGGAVPHRPQPPRPGDAALRVECEGRSDAGHQAAVDLLPSQ